MFFQGKKCLQLFNVVLGLHFKPKKIDGASETMEVDVTDLSRTPEVLQDTLVLDLLYSEAGQSLLNILGTGVDTIDKLVSLGSSATGGYALVLMELIKLAFSVLNRLLARKGKVNMSMRNLCKTSLLYYNWVSSLDVNP